MPRGHARGKREKPFAMTTPAEVEVLAADINAPFGYLIVLRSVRLTIELHE